MADQNTTARYDDLGQRTTDCCGCYSTYMDDGQGGDVLCCKACYNEVDVGQGDGTEFKAGVTEASYWKGFADHRPAAANAHNRFSREGA